MFGLILYMWPVPQHAGMLYHKIDKYTDIVEKEGGKLM